MTNSVYRLLFRPKELMRKYRSILEKIRDVDGRLLVGSVDYSRDRVQSTPMDRMPELVARRDELMRELKEVEQQITAAENDIRRYADRLKTPEEATIIFAHCLNGEKLDAELAASIGYSESQMFRLYREACKELDDMIKHDSE